MAFHFCLAAFTRPIVRPVTLKGIFMTFKEKFVFALYVATSVAVFAHATTEIYIAFKREHDYNKKLKENLAKIED
jgi:hypothetical protein